MCFRLVVQNLPGKYFYPKASSIVSTAAPFNCVFVQTKCPFQVFQKAPKKVFLEGKLGEPELKCDKGHSRCPSCGQRVMKCSQGCMFNRFNMVKHSAATFSADRT